MLTLDDLDALGLRVKPLEWSEPQLPNDENRYDHMIGSGGVSPYLITWKSWKSEKAFCCERDEVGGWLAIGYTIDEAKTFCDEDHVSRIIRRIERKQDADA